MDMKPTSTTGSTPLSRVKHVAHLARHFGKVRSFALEALLHLALSTMGRDLKASTGHTLTQNVDAMRTLLKAIRDGDEEQRLESQMFQEVLSRDDVDGGVVRDAEGLMVELERAQARVADNDFPSGSEIEKLFETYTALRIRISGFLRQVEALTAEWQSEDDNVLHMRTRFSSAVAELETMSGAINTLAINASVEASRAGDRGAAFGVIAKEMHRLSTQSSHVLRTTRDALGL